MASSLLSSSLLSSSGTPAATAQQQQQVDPAIVRTIAASAAEDFFIHYFYPTYDKFRHELRRYYRPQSVLVWCGRQVTGVEEIDAFARALPLTTHKIVSLDCHPVPLASPPSFVVSINGTVVFGDSGATRHFHHQLVASEDAASNKYCIASEVFRLLD